MISVPIQFYGGETFMPPPLLWQVQNNGCWIPFDLTNYTATFSARQSIQDPDPPLILATTANGMITIDGPAGSIQINIPASYTGSLIVPIYNAFWDLWAYSPAGVAYRLVGGLITVLESITRP